MKRGSIMNELQIFNYNTAEVRTVIINGEPWWVLKDVCVILGLSNPTVVAQRLEDFERAKFDLGRQGEGTIINESGLYHVIIRSDKPEARNFRIWITSEVIPAIRKTGGYIPVDDTDTDAEILAKAMVVAQKTIAAQSKRMGQLQITNSHLTVDNQIMQPKADYFDELVDRNLQTRQHTVA